MCVCAFSFHITDADRKSAMFREWKTSCSKNNRHPKERSVNGKLRKCKLAEESYGHGGTKGRARPPLAKQHQVPLLRYHLLSKWRTRTGTSRCTLQLLKTSSISLSSLMSTYLLSLFAKTITFFILFSLATCQERSKTLYIAGFFPTSHDIPQGSIGRGVLPAVRLALQHVNESPLFTKYKLDLVWNNTKVCPLHLCAKHLVSIARCHTVPASFNTTLKPFLLINYIN